MDGTRFLPLLLLLFVSLSVADLQSNDIMEQRSVNVEPDPCLSDVHAVLRDLTAKLASLQTKTEYLEKENQEQANKLLELQTKASDVDPIKEQLRGQGAELNYTINQVESLRRDREVGRVAFSASLFKSGGGNHGPISADSTLVFQQVFMNLGSAYNSNTGIFTAPVRGVYHFEYYILTANSHVAFVRLVKNGEVINAIWEGQSAGYGTAANGATLLLETGDVVFLRLIGGYRIHDDQDHYCSFAGRLIFLM